MEFDRVQFWQAFLGPYSSTEFVIYGMFFLMGALVFFGIDVKRSVQKDSATPSKFNFWFMLRDNVFRFFAIIVSIYIVIRFYEGLYGTELTELLALTLGVSIDALIGKGAGGGIKNIPYVKKKRESYITKLNNGP